MLVRDWVLKLVSVFLMITPGILGVLEERRVQTLFACAQIYVYYTNNNSILLDIHTKVSVLSVLSYSLL